MNKRPAARGVGRVSIGTSGTVSDPSSFLRNPSQCYPSRDRTAEWAAQGYALSSPAYQGQVPKHVATVKAPQEELLEDNILRSHRR